MQSRLDFSGKSFLDLYAGTGLMGFEAISRGFSRAVLVESDVKTARCLQLAREQLGLEDQVEIANTTVDKYLCSNTTSLFDVVFADPPYDRHPGAELVTRILLSPAFDRKGWVVIESPSRMEFPEKVAKDDGIILASLQTSRVYGGSQLTYYKGLLEN